MSNQWKHFTKRIPIKASAKAIYDAWTTQQGLESWFLRLAQFTKADGTIKAKNIPIEKGDHYKWLWYGYDDNTAEEKEILFANGWDQLKFSFSGGCIVSISIKQENGENICQLTQEMPMENINEQQHFYIDCGNGWTFYLANLKSILEGGNDLRNKNVLLKEVVNA
ncbi:hypothetical protein CAP36_01425 [Chitinophagaceae bacterium IBVUCB2]|nr:hypothetical protein CAP36_01425 [Chitinophagaceae bacterium IBVUCB2]